MTDRTHYDAVVIGAGLAGLHAARLIETAGLNVRVVEAQTRIGGRIHSMRQLGSNAEAGGTYIGAGYERVFAIAEMFDIKLIDVTPVLEFFREQDLALGNEIIRQSEWAGHPLNPFPENDKALLPWNYHRVLTMRENPLAAPEEWLDPKHAQLDVSVRDWMSSLGLSARAIEIGYGINSSFGTDAGDVSALLLLFRAAFSKRQRARAPEGSLGFTVENGVQRITDAMAEGLKNEIYCAMPVAGIADQGSRVLIQCADGQALTAEHAICTAPFASLRHVRIEPPLIGDLATAVAELRSQPVTQFYLAPRAEFWEEDGYAPSLFTDSLAGMVAAVRSGNDPSRITHLTAWVMGANAALLDQLSEAEAGQRVIEAIETVRPAAKNQLELIGMQSWGGDPYASGAWAYFAPGQIRSFGRGMRARHGRIHFCGEHLAIASRGMEGALESAETVAERILRM